MGTSHDPRSRQRSVPTIVAAALLAVLVAACGGDSKSGVEAAQARVCRRRRVPCPTHRRPWTRRRSSSAATRRTTSTRSTGTARCSTRGSDRGRRQDGRRRPRESAVIGGVERQDGHRGRGRSGEGEAGSGRRAGRARAAQASAASRHRPPRVRPPRRPRHRSCSTATVDRVKKAESELTAATQGVTDQTPLLQAAFR